MQKKPRGNSANDNATGISVGLTVNVPVKNWLDFKKRELVLIWTDGRETRYPLDDQTFKEYLESGTPLRNL